MIQAILKGITLGLLLTISVGPVVFSVIKQSINNGVKGGLAFIFGISFSDILLAIASNLFTEVFRSLTELRVIIGITGSVFLITVGVYFLFFKKVTVNAEGVQVFNFKRKDYMKLFIAGFLMNLLNPGIIIFWLTTSAAFVDNTIFQRIIIFGIAILMLIAGDIAKVILADKLRRRLTQKNIVTINKVNGVILIGFGIVLIWGLLFYGDQLPQ